MITPLCAFSAADVPAGQWPKTASVPAALDAQQLTPAFLVRTMIGGTALGLALQRPLLTGTDAVFSFPVQLLRFGRTTTLVRQRQHFHRLFIIALAQLNQGTDFD